MAVPKPQWHVKLSLSFKPECEWAPECSVKAEGVGRIPQATVVKASQSRAQGGRSANRGDGGGVGRTEQERPSAGREPAPRASSTSNQRNGASADTPKHHLLCRHWSEREADFHLAPGGVPGGRGPAPK